MKRRVFRLGLSFIASALLWTVCGPAASQSQAADVPLRSSWECLPGGTLAAVRIPNGKAVVDTLKESTKLGSVVFADERIEGLRELLVSQDWWEPVQEKLDHYGLTLDDFPQMLAGETGFAAVVADADSNDRSQAEPWPLGLVWFEPGQDLARRLWDGVQQEVEERQHDDHPVTRLDLDVAGQPAMLLTVPQERTVHELEGPLFLEDADELDEEDGSEAFRRTVKRAESKASTEVSYVYVLLTERQGHMLLAFTLDVVKEAHDRQRIDGLRGVFERFVAGHTGEPGTFVSRLQATPGMHEALPQQGVPFFEVLTDLRLMIRLATTADPTASAEELEELKQVFEATGIDQFGAVAVRVSLFDSALHTGVFLEAPRPRTGLFTLLDQPAVEARPPRWVPASVVSYSHVNLDLGEMYTQIKELIIQQVGEPAKNGFKRFETNVNGFAGTDMAGVLSSLGHRHMMLAFEPRLLETDEPDADTPFAILDRMAFVWAIENEEVWNRLLNASKVFAGMMQGAVEYREEQGFAGYRLTTPRAHGGLFLGKGYLVLAIGEGVLAQTLSTLNHPPEGRDALVNSDLYARAAELLPLEPGLSFELTDGNRYAGALRQVLGSLFNAPGGPFADLDREDDADFQHLMKELRRLMPTAEEMQNVVGVGVGTVRATNHGVEVKTVYELPE